MTDDVKARALELFRGGHNCSQAVFAAHAPGLGLDEATAVRLATGFGIGLSSGETCGAVSGAVMVLGMLHGGGGPDALDAKRDTYGLSQEFMERFAERLGGVRCREILGCDPSTDAGLKEARERGLFETVCCRAVAGAVEILGEME